MLDAKHLQVISQVLPIRIMWRKLWRKDRGGYQQRQKCPASVEPKIIFHS
jgi:hypothetical protein